MGYTTVFGGVEVHERVYLNPITGNLILGWFSSSGLFYFLTEDCNGQARVTNLHPSAWNLEDLGPLD